MKTITRLLILVLLIGANVQALLAQKPKKNIVLIMADDFNYWNGITTSENLKIRTPNLDKLALRGVLFSDAQAAAPVCNPSRQAMWSGFRPSTTDIEGNEAPWIRATTGFDKVVTMNQYFYQNGYYTWGAGKLYHSKFGEQNKTSDDDNWSGFSLSAIGGTRGAKIDKLSYSNTDHPEYKWTVNAGSATKENCPDTNVATETANIIRGYAADLINKDKPFFLACGLSKPHLAWDAPEDFYNFYDNNLLQDINLPGFNPNDFDDVEGVGPDAAYTFFSDLEKLPELRHMYAACLTLADFNAGIIIDAVENSIYRDNTIIVFMGDHGWILGEKPKLGKASQWDMANKTTLIIYDPSYKNASTSTTARVCKKVVSLQDIYPTLVELSGLPIKTDMEGNSLAALIENPAKADWDKPVAVTRQFDRIRTNKWSYCDINGDGGGTAVLGDMLYDIEKDPHEKVNMLHKDYTGMSKDAVSKIRTRLVFQLDSIKNIGESLEIKLPAVNKYVPKKLVIPGIIQAEDYDEGGYKQTYFDSDTENLGGQYRKADGTDIYITDNTIPEQFHLGGLSTGEWCNYTVKNFKPGNYYVDFSVRNMGTTNAVLQIYNRDLLLTELTIPASTLTWKTIRAPQIQLTNQSSTRLKIKVKSGSRVEFDNMKFDEVVSGVAVTGVTLIVCPTASMNINATQQLTATVLPTNATNKSVNWSSSNTAVATVSSAGLVTAKAAGSATITVTTVDGNKTAVCNVTVATSAPAQTPYGGVNRKIPGLIEAEHYDEGVEGSAFHDNTTKQGVLAYRADDMVDVVNRTAASNGKAVGYTLDGEWLEYKVDVTAGTYDIKLSYFCTISTAGDLKVFLGDKLLTTFTNIAAQTLSTVLAQTTIPKIYIEGGTNQTLRLEVLGAKFDIDAINFSPSATTTKISSGKTTESENVDNGFRIYPNPVSDILNLEFTDATSSKQIKVFNAIGQLVYSAKTTKGSTTIDVKTLNLKGVVMVQVVTGNSVYNNKVIIK